jgi:hypothetical protein
MKSRQHAFRHTVGFSWILPRAKKVSTGHFLAFVALRPPFRIPLSTYSRKQKTKAKALVFVSGKGITS